jgi:hypothetical protein
MSRLAEHDPAAASQERLRAKPSYGGRGLELMAWNAKAVEDKNIATIFNALDKTQNRGG